MSRVMKNSGIPWIGDIPSHWSVKRLQTQLYEINEKNNPVKTDFVLSLTNTRGVIPYTDKGDIGNKSKENHEEYKIAYPNTIVANSMNILIGSVGICNYYGCVSPVYYILKERERSDLKYYNYILSCVPFQKHLRQYANGILEIRLRLSCKDILQRSVPTPSFKEQQAIADFLDKKCGEIDEMISLQEKIVEELKAYKQSVITETVTKGLNPDAPMKDSGIEWIGQVPKHWRIARLRNLGTTQNGISQGGDFFGEGNPFVSYSDVYKNYSLPVEVKGLAKSNEKEQGLFSVKRGDVFFTRTSETIEEIGFSSVCLETIPQAVFAGFLIRFRPNDDTLDSLFAKYYFRSDIHRAFFVKEMNIVIRASLSQDLLKSLPVLLPSKNEQHEIGAFLDERCSEIDNLISVRQAKIEALKEYKKSIIYEYVTGKKELV